MNLSEPLPLLGGLSLEQFARRYWQKNPLLVRNALPGFKPLLDRAGLFRLAASADVQSRLVQRTAGKRGGWQLRHGPFERRALPALKLPGWTLLVQGVDLHDDRVHQLLTGFRFMSDARLDDVMISYASDAGGVGPHFDSYDVFLLQAQGRRRWRIGRQKDLRLEAGLPLKILARFEPEQEHVLEPGDLLYLPPRYAHDGIAEGECMTYSIGYRSPSRGELAREMLHMLGQESDSMADEAHYRDALEGPSASPAEIPAALRKFAQVAVAESLSKERALDRALGQYLTEPKAHVWFDPPDHGTEVLGRGALRLDRRSKMMFDAKHLFLNGEAYAVRERDFSLLRSLANTRVLSAADRLRLSPDGRQLVSDWLVAGWLRPVP